MSTTLPGRGRDRCVRFNRAGPVASSQIAFTQINLHKSKVASAQLTSELARMHTAIAMVQEPWLYDGTVRGLSNAGRLFTAAGGKPRTCIIVKGLEAELVPKHTSRDLTTVRVRMRGSDGEERVIIVASAYLPCQGEVPTQVLRDLVEDGDARRGGAPSRQRH